MYFDDVRIMPFHSGNTPVCVPSIGRTQTDADYIIEKDGEDNYAFEFVLSGKGYALHNGMLYTLEEGDVFILPPNCPRCYYADENEPFLKLWFLVIGDLPDAIMKSYRLNDIVYHAPACRVFFENLFKAAKSMQSYESICRLTAQTVQSIADYLCFSRERRTTLPRYLEEAKEYLDMHYTDNVKIDDIARKVHISPSQLTRSFRRYFNQSPYEYILQLKLDAAKILLSTSNFSVKQVSDQLGFCDEYYFSGLFKKRTGLPPSKFKK